MKTLILAGGKSSRMGANKALLPIRGIRLIESLVLEFSKVSNEVLIAAGDPALYAGLAARVLQDDADYAGEGPLAGMHAGFRAAQPGPCFLLACDLPFACPEIAQEITSIMLRKQADAAVPVSGGRIHPLYAAYDTGVTPRIEKILESGQRSVRSLLDSINTEYIPFGSLAGHRPEMLWNMNTPLDYEKARGVAEQKGR